MRVSQIKGVVTLIVSVLFSAVAFADAPADLGPAVGSSLPQPFAAVDSEGQAASFDSVKGEKGAVLLFFRSAKWCPFCKKQLREINKIAADLSAKGYPIVGISYDDTQVLADFKDKRDIGFTLLSDEGSKIIDTFGIRNTEYPEGTFAHGVPHPLIAIYGADGVLKSKLYESSYRDRPANEAILEAVESIG